MPVKNKTRTPMFCLSIRCHWLETRHINLFYLSLIIELGLGEAISSLGLGSPFPPPPPPLPLSLYPSLSAWMYWFAICQPHTQSAWRLPAIASWPANAMESGQHSNTAVQGGVVAWHCPLDDGRQQQYLRNKLPGHRTVSGAGWPQPPVSVCVWRTLWPDRHPTMTSAQTTTWQMELAAMRRGGWGDTWYWYYSSTSYWQGKLICSLNSSQGGWVARLVCKRHWQKNLYWLSGTWIKHRSCGPIQIITVL